MTEHGPEPVTKFESAHNALDLRERTTLSEIVEGVIAHISYVLPRAVWIDGEKSPNGSYRGQFGLYSFLV